MFLGFGKRNSTPQKKGTSQESPKNLSTPGLSLAAEGPNGGSRSTIQTTAGPLLSSTRFNSILDASTYANVNSPGFTSRVVNCASNGNSSYHESSATHQSKYSSVGLFPRVNLGGQSTLSILSPRNSQKVGKTPVRVRIAPPSSNLQRRHSICAGASEAIRDQSEISKQLLSPYQQSHRKEGSFTSTKNTDSAISPDNLQEASRKRILSECQDNYDETKKRRKKTEIPIPIPNPNNDVYHYRHVRAPAVPVSPLSDNTSQGKRAREKGSPEEQKRQRRKVCNTNNAIFSSLSSSRNLLERLTAQKRKSFDTSRSSSPLTPSSGKQVKERKPASDVTSTENNALSTFNEKKIVGASEVHTPISSKVVSKRPDVCAREKNDSGKTAINDSVHKTSCDYTTKLFRKDVSSNTPRTPTSKTPKQSLWVQAPEVDDLSCSLLNDDSKLDRPERLKSLLARVSGKDKNNTDKMNPTTSDAYKVTPKGSLSGTSLPGNTSLKAISPSSALTVTVSSTCTIMTSATVTSVNGVPSTESSQPPRSLPASVLSTQSSQSPLITESSKAGATSPLADVKINSSTLPSTSLPNPGSLFNSSGSVGALTGTSSNGLKSSFSMKSPVSSNALMLGETNSVDSPKATFQFGSTGSSLPTASKTQFNSTPSTEASSAVVSATVNTNSVSLSFNSKSGQTTSVSSSSFQFSSSQSNTALVSVPKPSTNQATFSFGSTGNAQSGASNSSSQLAINGTSLSALPKTPENATAGTTKSMFSFGSSTAGPSETPKSSFSFGSNMAVPPETPKPATENGSSSNLQVASTPSFQFGSSGPTTNGLAVPSFQTGSKTSTSSTSTFQFGPTSNGPKAAVQFGSTSTASSEAPKPSFQFGSSTNNTSAAPASSFQFGSNSNGSSAAPTSAVQFGSNSALSEKSSFQFGASNPSVASKPTMQFGSSNTGSSEAPKSAFQFGSGTSVASGNAKPTFSFGSSSTVEVSKPSMSFGSSNNGAPTTTSNGTFQFGGSSQNSSAPQFGAGSAVSPQNNQFGSNVSSQSANSAFQFGSSIGKSIDPVKPTFQFSSNSEKTFGSSIQGSSSAFSQVPQQSKGAFAFGQAANPSTNGNEAKSTFSFGAANANSASFASASNSSPFGASSAQSAQQSFGSGAPKSNGFGSTPSFGSAGSNSSSFSFSANSSATGTNTGAGGAFSFGQKQDQAAPTFSFNATVTSVPNQATQAPGLFSVGAGPSTSTRRVAKGRRR